MRFLLVFLLLPAFSYAQSEESRMLFLSINSKRADLNIPSLSYESVKQTSVDSRAIRVGIDNKAMKQDECDCKTESVFSASTLRELLSIAIDPAHEWHFLERNEQNATVSVVTLDDKIYAVVRTY